MRKYTAPLGQLQMQEGPRPMGAGFHAAKALALSRLAKIEGTLEYMVQDPAWDARTELASRIRALRWSLMRLE